MPKKPRETKRSKVRFPGLTKEVNPKNRWEHIDHDYLDKLTDEEKQWLSNFNEEYLSGNFNHPGKKFHKSKKDKRACYARNNARLRDTMSINRTKGWVNEDPASILENKRTTNPGITEDALIDMIDSADVKKK